MTDFWIWARRIEGRRQPISAERLGKRIADHWPYCVQLSIKDERSESELREWCLDQFGPEAAVVYTDDGSVYDPVKLYKTFKDNKLVFHTDRLWVARPLGRFYFAHQRDATAFKLRWI